MPDFTVYDDGGSLVLLTPQSEAAHDWADEHLPEDALTWGAQHAYVIEPRYFEAIAQGIQEEGLVVEPE